MLFKEGNKMKKKPKLTKQSTGSELAAAVADSLNRGYLDALKQTSERKDADIVSAAVTACMARHKAAIIQAYRAGFAQGKQHV